MTLIIIGIYIIFHFTENHKRQNTVQIFIDVVGPHDHVLLSLMTLPHSSSMYQFKATRFIDRVCVTGCIRPQLRLFWGTFVIQHKLLAQKQRLPLSFNINHIKAMRLHRILRSRFEILMFTKEGTSPQFRLMELEGSTWQQQLQERRQHTNQESVLRHSKEAFDDGHEYVV